MRPPNRPDTKMLQISGQYMWEEWYLPTNVGFTI